MRFSKKCPKCDNEMIYTGNSGKSHLNASIRDNTICKPCKKKYYTHSEETRKKLSISLTGRVSPRKGKMVSDETKKRMSITNLGRVTSDETKKKISIATSGKNHHAYGKKFSEEHKKNLSIGQTGRIGSYGYMGCKRTDEWRQNHSKLQTERYSNIGERTKTGKQVKEAMHRPDVRKKHIDGLMRSEWVKVKTDDGQVELLEKWNRLGFNFEINYQIHTDEDLFYIDGYDKEKNVVFEYDSKYHFKTTAQQKKDLERQYKIIKMLKPKAFWRYNSINKTFKNVIGEGEE